MINRRSTPSGDGRGRGRTGGSDRSAGRGGRPAFRTERDDRGYGGRTSGDRDRSYGDRDRGRSAGDRSYGGDRDNRGYGRDSGGDGRPSRDSLRADRGGSRARYGGRDGASEGRYPRDDRNRRDDRYAGDRGGDRDRGSWPRGDRDDRPARADRDGGYSRDDRSDRSDRPDRYGRSARAERPRGEGFGGPRGDRDRDRSGDRSYGGDRSGERGGNRGWDRDRDGNRGGYRADRPERRTDRSTDRPERRTDRFGDRPERRTDRFGDRPERRTDRFGDRSEGRGERFGERSEGRGYRSDDRGGYRSERGGGRSEQGAPREAGSTRSRYGRRDGDAPRGVVRANARGGRRDDVQTIGRAGRTGGPGGGASGDRKGPGSPQQARIKAGRQPIRDRDLFPEGYTDERDTTEVPDGVRLQKVLAQAGVASRRACEEMIGEGRVTVNGQVVRRFGAKVDPAKQVIHVDGKRIPTAPDLVYYALNKPIGVVSTMEDPQGRPCLADFVQELAPRLFHVGRLDTETEGLLLLTNDGELANRLTHPSYGVQKKYWAKVPGPIPRDLGRRLKQGIELEDGLARADSFAIVQEHAQQALVEVVLHEGRKHVVRRMLEEAGHRVIDLARIEFGPVKLGRTKPGTIRALTLKEVGELYAAVKL
ncbi:Ribosomal large subunit pseudouridine synthase B [Nonomuraea coxensis DSM 45129]|uniref:Pseudouridine synthase n=1 Tax=Nonomuraea coxensis DSM 45129 TaxID=1122611 RepID=A0ABX8U1M2_9ACTN|nr:pseudouridine synthase [Nonomuraea coxensis]QYC40816.1 Ribosomal large subunit pseudouridine synthase B [Nonomuraea coxensis DSM 45129]